MTTTDKTNRNVKTKKNDMDKATQANQNGNRNMIKMNDTYTNVDIDKIKEVHEGQCDCVY
eukprot:873665-Ditylum_brightwellii.AAC.1